MFRVADLRLARKAVQKQTQRFRRHRPSAVMLRPIGNFQLGREEPSRRRLYPPRWPYGLSSLVLASIAVRAAFPRCSLSLASASGDQWRTSVTATHAST